VERKSVEQKERY
jgi:hypothetical protein